MSDKWGNANNNIFDFSLNLINKCNSIPIGSKMLEFSIFHLIKGTQVRNL